METREIIEGNKLISEFMGEKAVGGYHQSWDWLIPACAKFDALMMDDLKDRSKFSEYSDLLDDAVTVYAIEIAFWQLVECIKWYNSSAEPTRTTTG